MLISSQDSGTGEHALEETTNEFSSEGVLQFFTEVYTKESENPEEDFQVQKITWDLLHSSAAAFTIIVKVDYFGVVAIQGMAYADGFYVPLSERVSEEE